jgi:uncharacterized membrane protein
MLGITFIVLARAIHVMAGVAWAGTIFVLAMVIVPLAVGHGAESAGRWLGMVARRAGMISGISALLTVLSGIYLFAALHPHDDSIGGLILKAGAVAALFSFAVGALLGRPAGQRLAKLQQTSAGEAAPSTQTLQELASLRRRSALSARLAAGLLGAAVFAMAVFRYASAFA